MSETKALVRKKLNGIRSSLSVGEVRVKSSKILENLKKEFDFDKFDNVLMYFAINNEVDLAPLAKNLGSDGKDIFLIGKYDDQWKISRLINFEQLESGPHGILQPKALNEPSDLDLALIPSIGFSKDGCRLGYGEGVYDRVLELVECLKVGVVYDFQIIDEDFCEDHDLKVDMIVTESRALKLPNVISSRHPQLD